MASGGTLRAAYIVTNLAQAQLNPITGAITGVSADLARELGRQAGLPVTIIPVANATMVLDAVRTGTVDIGFVAPNPARTGIVLYSQPYMLVQQSALVPDGSSIQSVAELDRPGQTIGVNTDDSVGIWLRGRLTAGRLRDTPDYTLRDAVRWFADGSIQAFAGNRQRLREATKDDPGLHLLPDNLYGVPQTVAVPLDRADRVAAVDAAIAALRTSGFLADAVSRSGVDGISVAPAR